MADVDPLILAIRDAGRELGLTQTDMCDKAGLNRQLLTRALTGKTSMNFASVRALAQVVGCDVVLSPRLPVDGGEA